MTRADLIEKLTAIFHKEGHDLESLTPEFQAERFVELLDEAGLMIVDAFRAYFGQNR